MGRKWIALVLFLFVTNVRAATTVTGKLLDPATAAVTSNAYARFELKNYGTNLPRVLGTNVILPSMKDVYPDGTGLISTTLTGNELINPGNTWYRVTYYKGGTRFYICDVVVTALLSGTVNTNGTTVTWVTGNKFPYYLATDGNIYTFNWAGTTITINGVGYIIASVNSDSSITLTTSAGVQAGVAYSHGSNSFDLNTAPCLNMELPSAFPYTACPICQNGADGAPGPIGPQGPAGTPVTCDTTKTVDLYVDPAGNDTTGDGTIGNPWLTVQKAWDTGVPYSIDGKYIIHLKSAGTYVGQVNLTNRFFPSGGLDYTECGSATPCSQVKIIGDSAAPETYILSYPFLGNDVVFVGNGISVILEYLSIEDGGYGLRTVGDSRTTLGGVQFKNNLANTEIFDNSVVYVEPNKYLTDNFTNLRVTDSGIFTPFTGIAVNGTGQFTDWCPNFYGDAVTTNWLSCEGTNAGYRCGEAIGGSWTWTGTVSNINNPFFGENGLFRIASLQYDGQGGVSPPMELVNTDMVFEFTGGSSYTFTNSSGTIDLERGSFVSNVTNGAGGTVEIRSTTSGHAGGVQVISAANKFKDLGNITGINNADLQRANYFKFTMTGDTVLSFTNGVHNNFVTIVACQDGAGAHNLTLAGGTFTGVETVGATASKCNMQSFVSGDGTDWYASGPMIKNQ